MSVLLEWNRDRKESTMWGRGTPAGSFIDGCVRKKEDEEKREEGEKLTLIFQRSRGRVVLSRFCSNITR